MTVKVRLLFVATVCEALASVAAVATSASWQTRRSDHQAVSTPARPVSLGPDGEPMATATTGADGEPPAEATGTTTAVGPTTGSGTSATTTTGREATTTTTTRTSATTTTTTAATGPKCPNPKTCDVYRIIDQSSGGPNGGTKGWRPAPDGVVRIEFYVNPTPPAGSGLTENQMEAAFTEGTRIIEAANPRIDFIYKGRTTRVPQQFDGFNDFQFGDRTWHLFDREGYIYESDIRPTGGFGAGSFAYTPCEQRDDSCTDTGTGKSEVLTYAVHEPMHAAGLADLPVEPATAEMTMDPSLDDGGGRSTVTLAYGDVLGLRALYPTSAPMPPIYSP